MKPHKLALVHDWLYGLRGGERCLQAFLCLYKDSDLYSLFYAKGATDKLIDSRYKGASLLNAIPGVRSFYRILLPLFPFFSLIPALATYPIRISLSHAASKNIRGSKFSTRHICYCFTPMRYVWDQSGRYLGWKAFFAQPLIKFLQLWDKRGSSSVSDFIAISNFVAARIRKYYGRRARVIFPPVSVSWLAPEKALKPKAIDSKQRAFLFAGALVPYKGADFAIKACSDLGCPLWVAGNGPELEKLKKIAGPTVHFLGKVGDSELAYLLNNCRALLFPCKEDFGIIPVEAQAAGKPVIALYAGACKQTINACKHWLFLEKKHELASQSYTGVFIRRVADSMQLEALKEAIRFFEQNETAFKISDCKAQAKKFDVGSFYDSWKSFAQTCPGLMELPICDKDKFVADFENLRMEKADGK